MRCPYVYNIFRDIEFIRYNIGFTYTNSIKKQSLIIIGLQDNESQLINTIAHEARHLQQHIANVENLDENSETVCYLIGYIVQKIYEQCKICELL